MAETDLQGERPAPAENARRPRSRRIIPDRELIDGTAQSAAEFGEELPADEYRRIAGVPAIFHPVYPLDDPGDIGIKPCCDRVDIIVRNGNPKRHLAPGGDHPSGEKSLRLATEMRPLEIRSWKRALEIFPGTRARQRSGSKNDV